MRYKANTGGHAPGHLREAFPGLLDVMRDEDFALDTAISGISHGIHEAKGRTVNWLIGQLWNCTDVLPSEYCGELDIEQGSTYAQAVRKLKDELIFPEQ